MIIREYAPSTDDEAIARLFARANYGPQADQDVLEGSRFGLVIEERVAELFLVAASGDNVHGTLAFVRACGRRVARDGELFCSLFVIDPSHRVTALAGQLFKDAFERLTAMGVSALRLEVSPSNSIALSLFERAGFCWTEQVRADEDGYCELVSYLPLIMRSLSSQLDANGKGSLMPKASIRALGAPRTKKGARGPAAERVSYTLETKDFTVDIEVDDKTGEVSRSELRGLDVEGFEISNEFASRWEGAAECFSHDLDHGILLSVDTAGTLRLTKESGEVVLVDHLPVARGIDPVGWRRPLRFSPETRRTEAGVWTTTWISKGIDFARQVEFTTHGFSVTATSSGNQRLVVSPWVTMRKPEVYVQHEDGSVAGGVHVRGIWPPDFTDFEGLTPALPAHVRRSVWQSDNFGLSTSWTSDVQARLEGRHLPQLIGSPGAAVHFQVEIVEPLASNEASRPVGLTFEGIPSPHVSAGVAAEVAEWTTGKSRSREIWVSQSGRSRVDWSPAAGGLTSWRCDDLDVLNSPFPNSRKLGPLPQWSAGIWVSRTRGLWDSEQGIEWPDQTDALSLQQSPSEDEGLVGWSLGHLSSSTTTGLRLRVPGGRTTGESSIVSVVPLALSDAPVHLSDARGGRWTIGSTDKKWSVGTDIAVIQLRTGRYLRVAPRIRAAGEVFLRSLPGRGVMVSLVSDSQSAIEWDLEVHDHLALAIEPRAETTQ